MKAVILRLFLYSCTSINLLTGWLKKSILIPFDFLLFLEVLWNPMMLLVSPEHEILEDS